MDFRDVQTALLSRGFNPGLIDGRPGKQSTAAIAAFQRSAGLYPDGVAGLKTIAALAAQIVVPSDIVLAPARQHLGAIGFAALLGREARVLKAYRDSKGIWTIGIGHTAAAGGLIPYAGLVITREECDALFARDIVQYEDAVRSAIKVEIADHEFDALVSICYNIGTGGLAKSSFVKLVNAGAPPVQIRAAILAWRKPPEILSRRTAEADQFQTPYATRLPKARSTDAAPIKIAA